MYEHTPTYCSVVTIMWIGTQVQEYPKLLESKKFDLTYVESIHMVGCHTPGMVGS